MASFDPDEASAFSSPASTFASSGVLCVVFLVIGLEPGLQQLSGARATLPCVLLAGAGGILTFVAHRKRCRPMLGALATLFDNGMYASSVALAALTTNHGFGVGLALVQTLMVLTFPASFYGFSLLLTLVLTVPTLCLVALLSTDVTVSLILIAGCVMTVPMLMNTQKRRELVLSAQRLQQAINVTDQVLDIAMQRALTTTLLGLGNFLHELRNSQYALRASLDLLSDGRETAEQREAIESALQASRLQQSLLEETLEELRRQAQPSAGHSMLVGEVLERALRGPVNGLRVDYRNAAPEFEVHGEPAHLSTVVRNLLRNARQAGAVHVQVEAKLEPAAGSLLIHVRDDGPGIAPERRAQLFQPFMSEGKPAGTGLGLYLCRRYVELMGGRIEAESEHGAGAVFTIRLPGRRMTPVSAPVV